MATRAQKIRLSIFLIMSSTLLLILFIVLVGSRFFKNMDTYYIEYKDISVTGLEPGAAVKFHGVQVGRVTSLSVKDAATVLIEIEVKSGTPIKQDTEAVLTLAGITGLKFVELIGGSMESELLPENGTIVAGQSVFETITGRAEIVMAKVEQLLQNLNELSGEETRESFQRLLTSTSDMTTRVNDLISQNSQSMTSAMASIDTLAARLAVTAGNINSTTAHIQALVESGTLETTAENVAVITGRIRTQMDSLRLAETVENIDTLVRNANTMVVHYDLLAVRARDDILQSLSNLEEALTNLREATDVIRDNPSVLIRGRQTTGDRIE